MVETYKYEKRYHYPHMKPADIAIWERFIDKNPDAYDTCQYDFWVGSPPPFNPIVNEATEGSADGLYRRKIDVVGSKNGVLDIIELKPKAGLSAIGQVRGYVALYVRDETPPVRPNPVIITDQVSQDILEVAAGEGVKILIA